MSERKIVVLDAGHGGKDCGASGIWRKGDSEYWLHEKIVNLNVCKFARNYIKKKKLPFDVLLTREGDYYMTLSDRCRYANCHDADIFVSVHTNARKLKGKFGIELESFYYYSTEGHRLAAHILAEVYDTMTQYHNIQTILAKIFPQLRRPHMKFFDRGVKIGQRWSTKKQEYVPFYVLKHTRMPAALMELGFLSDPEEAKYLSKRNHQKIAAQGIVKGIQQYFNIFGGDTYGILERQRWQPDRGKEVCSEAGC